MIQWLLINYAFVFTVRAVCTVRYTWIVLSLDPMISNKNQINFIVWPDFDGVLLTSPPPSPPSAFVHRQMNWSKVNEFKLKLKLSIQITIWNAFQWNNNEVIKKLIIECILLLNSISSEISIVFAHFVCLINFSINVRSERSGVKQTNTQFLVEWKVGKALEWRTRTTVHMWERKRKT